jgi:hypothetical protein
MKLLILLFFSLILGTGFSQKDKEKILANFDYVEYYPDSTIRSAHQFTGATLERFTVEFNEVGMPVAMGNYQKGKRIGTWIFSNGSSSEYPEMKQDLNPGMVFILPENHKTGNLRPGCGTGTMQAIQHFRTKYQGLLNP